MNQSVTRRCFMKTSAAASSGLLMHPAAHAQGNEKPNILWVTSEDNGPHLGCYGDSYSTTPNLDALASRGMIYRHAWSTAPVCAPARTTIISGVYPPCTGSEHMRSMTSLPSFMKMFPCYLREAGYYCTNNRKEDYNLHHTGQVWDESSNNAHWRNRAEGQPFFAVFNFTTTHESQIRRRPHEAVHDPAQVSIPAYHPDTPEVRQDRAQYYDKITEMDAQVGGILQQLEEDGLAEDTIVVYWGDHGPGLPRGKRWPYNSGLHVPMIVSVPARFRHLAPSEYITGGESNRLVGFIDLAPSMLSLTGIRPPEWMQGNAFLGEFETEPPRYQFGFRGRMDERYDLVRVCRDEQYIYMRHFMPHKIYGQHINYMFQTPTTQVWKQMYDNGKLNKVQSRFWEPKPHEELYDLEADPDEVNNLAENPAYLRIRNRMKRAVSDWVVDICDVGFLPEDEIHRRSEGETPYDMGHDPVQYPVSKIVDMAEKASSRSPRMTNQCIDALSNDESAIRYWGALGLMIRGEDAVMKSREALKQCLEDENPSVRVTAAHTLGLYGPEDDLPIVLSVLLDAANSERNGVYLSMLALNAISELGEKADPIMDDIRDLPRETEGVHGRMSNYVPRLLQEITGEA